MSTLLVRWLNEDVELSHNITVLEEDFANGFYFGELLYRYNLQPDFKHFKNVQSAEAIVDNFVRLEPTLRSLNITFESKTVNEVMTRKKGVAGKLLYQIRTVLESSVNASTSSKKETSVHVSNPEAKTKFREMQHKFFEERLRSKYSESIVTGKMNMHLNKFEQEKRRKEEREREAIRAEKEMAEQKVHARRQAIVQRDRENKSLLDGWEQEGKAAHRRAMKAKKAQEKRDLQYELAVATAKEERAAQAKKEAAEEASGGIDLFEKNLQRLRSENTQSNNGATPQDGLTAGNVTAVQHAQRLQEKLPSSRQMKEQAKAYTASIKVKKAQETWARKERQQRRRKLMLQETNAHQQLEDKRTEDALLDKLLRRSAEERRVAAQLMAVREEKEQLRRNRIIRQQQYAERREKDYQESLARDSEWGRIQRAEYQEKARREETRLQEHKRRLADIKHAKHTEFCLGFVGQVVELASKVGRHMETTGELVPPPLFREWNSYLVKGVPLPEDPTPDQEATDIGSGDSSPPTFLDDEELEHYVNQTGNWARPESVDPEPENELLKTMVEDLITLTAPPEPEPEDPELPPFPIRAAVIGKPFSGQTAVSAQIAERYGLTVFTTEKVVASALKAAEDGETKLIPLTEEELAEREQAAGDSPAKEGEEGDLAVPFRTEPSDRHVLGLSIKEVLASGKPVSDELVAKCVAAEVRRIADTPGERQGWILDGYPRTLEQAQLLEHELTGYIVPPKKKGGKGKSQAKAPPKAGKKTKLAPKAEQAIPAAPEHISGIDTVVVLDIEDDLASRRCNGRRVDPETETEYHLEFNPPPEDQPEIGARLVEPDDQENVSKQLHHRLAAFAKEKPVLSTFFELFGTESLIDGSGSVSDIADNAGTLFQEILDRKAAIEAQRVAAEEAAALAEKEAEEERLRIEAEEKAKAEEAARIAAEEEAAAATTKGKKSKDKAKSSADTSKNAAGGKTDDTAEEVEEEPKVLDTELAGILMQQWDATESLYCDRLKQVFGELRQLRKAALIHTGSCRRHMRQYLNRPHRMQPVISSFQVTFNQIPSHLRKQVDTKDELHLRLSQLKEELWEISDQRRDEAEEERNAIIGGSWISQQGTALVVKFVSLLQVEADRFFASQQVIKDYYEGKNGLPPSEAQPTDRFVNLENLIASEPTGKKGKADKGDKKKGAAPTEDKPAYRDALQNAFSVARSVLSGESDDKKGKKKGGNDDKKASKKGKDKGAAGPVDIPEIAECIEKEMAVSEARFNRLEVIATEALDTLEKQQQFLSEESRQWIIDQFRDEVSAISGLHDHVVHVIETEATLQEEIVCQGSKITINPKVHTIGNPPEPTPVVPGPRDDALQFRCSQISALAERFKNVAPNGALRKVDFVTLLLHLAGTADGHRLLPQEWLTFTRKHLDATAQVLDYLNSDYVDYRSFCLAVLPLARPTRVNLKLAKAALAAADKEGHGFLTLEQFHAVPMWFDKVSVGVDSPAVLRDTLFDIMSQVPESTTAEDSTAEEDAPAPERVLHYDSLLLSLCKADDALEGLRWAVGLFVEDTPGKDKVAIAQLHRILHHGTGLYTEGTESSVSDPVPLDLLETVCNSLEVKDFELSIDTLRKNTTGLQITQASRNYLYTDIYAVMDDATANEGRPQVAEPSTVAPDGEEPAQAPEE